MEFKQGMLGVVIVSLALVGALFGNYLAGVEASQYEVTKYSYLADVSGLFDYDQSPQYITYDPSSNYTGYYSEDSYSVAMDKYYFAEDDVSYTPNTDGRDPPNIRPNNYKVSLEPTVNPQTTIDLSTLTLSNGKSTNLYYHTNYEVTGGRIWDNSAYTLKQIIDEMNLASTSVLRIDLGNVNWPSNDYGGLTIDTVLFIPSTWYQGPDHQSRSVDLLKPGLDITQTPSYENPNWRYHFPYQSIVVDVENNRVTPYYGAGFTEQDSQTYTMDTMYVCFGNSGGIHLENYLNLDTDMPYQLIINQPASYLDPNYGVALKEANQ